MRTKQITYQVTLHDDLLDFPAYFHETVSGLALDIPSARVCLRKVDNQYVIDDYDTGFRVSWLSKNLRDYEALGEAEFRMQCLGEKYHVARAAVLSRGYFA